MTRSSDSLDLDPTFPTPRYNWIASSTSREDTSHSGDTLVEGNFETFAGFNIPSPLGERTNGPVRVDTSSRQSATWTSGSSLSETRNDSHHGHSEDTSGFVQAGPDAKCIDSPEIQESNPLLVPRKKEQILVTGKPVSCAVKALETSEFPHFVCPPIFARIDPARGGWEAALHPDGSLYFYKQFDRENQPLCILTDAYLYREDMLNELTEFMRYIWNGIPLAAESIDMRQSELVLNVKVNSGQRLWSYYFIDHVHRLPFWLRDHDLGNHIATTDKIGASSPDHRRYLLRSMYWEHYALYPRVGTSARIIPEEDYRRLVAELTWCAAESVIAPIKHTAPFTAEEAIMLRDQMDFFHNGMEKQNKQSEPAVDLAGKQSEHYVDLAGRILSVLERWHYNFLHGTQVIRRFRGQSVLPPQHHTALYQMVLPLLFYAPLAHLYDCKGVYLDGVLANEPEWTNYVTKLLAEWQDFVLYATILLNANLAFLSVPNTVPDDSSSSDPSGPASASGSDPVSIAAILSYCSMLASIGSIVVGLLLVRQHRGQETMENSRRNKNAFLNKRRSERFEFEPLSILYSLPYVLLIWSILLFLIAFMAFTQVNSNSPTQGTTGAFLFIIVSLTVWCISMGWGTSQSRAFFHYSKGRVPSLPMERASRVYNTHQSRRRPGIREYFARQIANMAQFTPKDAAYSNRKERLPRKGDNAV